MRMLLALVAAALFGYSPPPPVVCSVGELRESPGYRYRVERIREFVDSATVVVRAVAVRAEATPPARSGFPSASTVSFAIEERLRGAELPDRLRLPGVLVEQDDFNRGPVPYTIVRPSGQRGSCFTLEYRIGAEYLLILKDSPRGLTPFWMPLAPFNEQIRGSDDPWVEWVRQQLESSPVVRPV